MNVPFRKPASFKPNQITAVFKVVIREPYFDAFLSLTRDIPEFEYHVNLEMLDAFSSGRESRQRLYIENLVNLNTSVAHMTFLSWKWTTSSNHVVHVEGDSEEGFRLYLGEDESEYFYPTVMEKVR